MRIWVNGELQDESAATVSVFDHGFTVGDGVFETIKVVEGVPFALRRHLDRLARSASGLGLPEPDLAEVAKACAEVVGQEPAGNHRLRITYTGGPAPMGSERGTAGQTLVLAMAAFTPYPPTTAIGVVP